MFEMLFFFSQKLTLFIGINIKQLADRYVSLFFLFEQGRREELFRVNQKYKKFYNFIKKNDGKLSPEQLQKVTFEREFLSNLLKKFIRVLGTISAKGKAFGPRHKKTCLRGF